MEKSLLFCTPALAPIVKVDEKADGTFCTFGWYFGGKAFPEPGHVLDEIACPSQFEKAALHFIHLGLTANDKGKFALSRLYLSRLLRYMAKVNSYLEEEGRL